MSELSSHENSITSRCGMITVIGVGKGGGGQGGHCPHNLFCFFLRHYDNSEHGKYVPSFARCILVTVSQYYTCPSPPPPLPTPMILCHGGSLELVKILNNLGAVACNDTRNHLSVQVVERKEWLDIIQRRVWMKADLENHNVPTTDALRLHWHKCLWVLELCHLATD